MAAEIRSVTTPVMSQRHEGPVSTLIGTETSFSKTISDYDIYAFASVSYDNHPNHTDEEYARKHGLGGRVAQGSMMVGLMSGGITKYLDRIGRPAVSYGYDRVRFTKGVHIGDTITVLYRIVRADDQKRRTWADVTCTNQRGEIVAVGTHITHFQV